MHSALKVCRYVKAFPTHREFDIPQICREETINPVLISEGRRVLKGFSVRRTLESSAKLQLSDVVLAS